jgi:hypothetical protein
MYLSMIRDSIRTERFVILILVIRCSSKNAVVFHMIQRTTGVQIPANCGSATTGFRFNRTIVVKH